jgi:hypothetical protein
MGKEEGGGMRIIESHPPLLSLFSVLDIVLGYCILSYR